MASNLTRHKTVIDDNIVNFYSTFAVVVLQMIQNTWSGRAIHQQIFI